jgi:hypothetical protein
MSSSIGSHQILTIGVLGGLIAVFAYIKAIMELRRNEIAMSGFVTAGDISDLASRLTVPYVLIAFAFVIVARVWVETLVADHQRIGIFAARILAFAAVLVVPYQALSWWAPLGTRFFDDEISICFLVFVTIAIAPAIWLAIAGRLQGVNDDDVCQQSVLRVLRLLANPFILFGVFVGLGCVLLPSNRLSVLFDVRMIQAADEANLPTRDARQYRVVESSKAAGPMLIKDYFRFSGVWNIRATTASLKRVLSGGRAEFQWVSLAAVDVACVRDLSNDERASEQLSRQCTRTDPPAAVRVPPVGWRYTDNIAKYAVRELGCDPRLFQETDRIAIAMLFERGQPRTLAGAENWNAKGRHSFDVPIGRLHLPGLRELGTEESTVDLSIDSISRLSSNSAEEVWVLGFASTRGNPSSNSDLSERRAVALRSVLMSLHSGGIIRTRGLGEAQLSGVSGVEDDVSDQLAVAFLCRTSDGTTAAREGDQS